jgi:CubicO group peptidase (beta-lactamase class C family)
LRYAFLSFGLTFRLAVRLIFGLYLAQMPLVRAQTPINVSPIKGSVGQALAADLTWSQAERDARFGHMDFIFPTHLVHRAGLIRRLHIGPALTLPSGAVDAYMTSEHVAGLLVLVDGRVQLEGYGLGATPATRWAGFSMTKAVTDTLVGVALHAGTVRSLDDGVTHYLPTLAGGAYDGVSVRQVMTMTSGVRWNENYTTADADNVKLYTTQVARGLNSTVEYMRHLPRAGEPGSRWLYNTGETDLLGVLLRRATGKTLAEQLSAAVWQRAGMEHDATWIATDMSARGEEFGGSGLSATLSDWGRLGLWVMEGGAGAVDAGWILEATRAQVKAGSASYGYGWWPQEDGSFAALGIFGQSMLIDPQRKLVIVIVGDWPEATGAGHSAARVGIWQQVKAAVDAETRPSQ